VAEKTKSKKSEALKGQGVSFEDALAELEEIIGQFENGDLTLDQSLALFEKGVALLRIGDGHLKNAQGRVTELLKGENGEYVERVLGTTLDSFIGKDTNDA
jgi:exodeoxyribonuclease VII small subunit